MDKGQIEELTRAIRRLAINGKEIMNIEEVAEYLGLQKATIYIMTSNGILPHYKPKGKLLYFDKAEIDKWIKTKKDEE